MKITIVLLIICVFSHAQTSLSIADIEILKDRQQILTKAANDGVDFAFNQKNMVLLQKKFSTNFIAQLQQPASILKMLLLLKDDITIDFYITRQEDLPQEWQMLEKKIVFWLQQMHTLSEGKIKYKVVYLDAANIVNPELARNKNSLEQKLIHRVKPFSVEQIVKNKVIQYWIYSCIVIRHQKEHILPQVAPQILPDLPFEIATRIYLTLQKSRPVVAIVTNHHHEHHKGHSHYHAPRDVYQGIKQLLRARGYNVQNVKNLSEKNPLPEKAKMIVVLNPSHLGKEQKQQIANALSMGKIVFLAVQNYNYEYQAIQDFTYKRVDNHPQVNDWLKHYGVTVEQQVLMDEYSFVSGNASKIFPIHIRISKENITPHLPRTQILKELLYPWGTALEIDENILAKNQLRKQILFTTSHKAWKEKDKKTVRLKENKPEKIAYGQYPLMAIIEGIFPNPYTQGKIVNKNGRLMIIGCAMMFQDNFMRYSADLLVKSLDPLINLRLEDLTE